MKFDPPKNNNYAAQVIRIPALVTLEGLDNLVGVPALGHQALTQKVGAAVGELKIAFTAETQLSEAYAKPNNLFREPELNADTSEKGYLEKHRRIKAIKFRGHRSDALLMPLDSIAFTGINPADLQEGDTFDTLNGIEICRKFELPVKAGANAAKSKVEKAFKRVDSKLFPEHLSTDNYFRNKHLLDPNRESVVTQKLHGTSIRVGRVPCLQKKTWRDKLAAKLLKVTGRDYTYDWVPGSRKVIKDVNNPDQNHYYGTDIWTEYGEKIQSLLPEGYIVYGELIGWTSEGGHLQANYTYDLPKGKAELYVYRVAVINEQGTLADLSWDGVKEFCIARGLKYTPELARLKGDQLEEWIEAATDAVFHDDWSIGDADTFIEEPIRLSNSKTVDEGVCIRQEGIVPTILKAKSPAFLQHETKLLDKGELDLESAEAFDLAA